MNSSVTKTDKDTNESLGTPILKGFNRVKKVKFSDISNCSLKSEKNKAF